MSLIIWKVFDLSEKLLSHKITSSKISISFFGLIVRSCLFFSSAGGEKEEIMISWVHLQKALKQKWTTNLYNLREKMDGTLPLADPLEIFWQDFHTWQSLWNFSFLKVLFFNFVCISKAELSKTYCLRGMNQNLSWPSFLVCPWDP